MKVLSSFVRIVWAVLGVVGIGMIAGEVWLAVVLVRTPAEAPLVQFRDVVPRDPLGCAALGTLPRDAQGFADAIRASGLADARTYALRAFACTSDADATQTFLAVLRTAAAGGDGVASDALDAIAAPPCATIAGVAGIATDGRAAATAMCVAAARFRPTEDPGADVRRRTMRFAELLALVDADLATPPQLAEICTDASVLPPEVTTRYERFVPGLSALLAQLCAVQPMPSPPEITSQ